MNKVEVKGGSAGLCDPFTHSGDIAVVRRKSDGHESAYMYTASERWEDLNGTGWLKRDYTQWEDYTLLSIHRGATITVNLSGAQTIR